jgi:hypothetical protein
MAGASRSRASGRDGIHECSLPCTVTRPAHLFRIQHLNNMRQPLLIPPCTTAPTNNNTFRVDSKELGNRSRCGGDKVAGSTAGLIAQRENDPGVVRESVTLRDELLEHEAVECLNFRDVVRFGSLAAVVDQAHLTSCSAKSSTLNFDQTNEGDRAARTLGEHADSLAEICSLAINPMCILQHAHNKAKLTQQAMLALAARGDVALGEAPHGDGVVHRLQERVCVRIKDVSLESAVQGPVIEPARRGQCAEE